MDTLNALRAQAFDVTRQLVEQYRAMRQQDPEISRHLGPMASLMDQLEPIVQQWQSIGSSLVSDQPPTSTTKPHGGTEGKLMSSASNWVKSQCKFAQGTPPAQPAGQPPMGQPAAPEPAPEIDYTARWKAQQEERRKKNEAHKNAYYQKFQSGEPFQYNPASKLQTTNWDLEPELDPKYHGPQGEQAWMADGQPDAVPVTLYYDAEWEPADGDGWNEPRTEEGWVIQLLHVVTEDGRDIYGFLTPGEIEGMEEEIVKGQGHPRDDYYEDPRDRYAAGLSWYKSAKDKKKKHKSCKSCGGWVGYWMSACPGCGHDHSDGDGDGDSGNGNSVSSGTAAA